MKITKILSVFGLAVWLTACGGAPTETSGLDGHYENATAEEMEIFIDRQVVIPEYQPVDGVIVGLPLISYYGREDLIEEIFRAGANRVWINIDYHSDVTLESPIFENLGNRLRAIPAVSADGTIEYRDRLQDIRLVRQKPRQSMDDSVTVWARDWAPLGAVNTELGFGSEMRLLDFNYYPRRAVDDRSPQALEIFKGWDRISVPVYNEGGNFMIDDDGICMMTRRVVEANSKKEPGKNDEIWDEDQIAEFYKDFAGCTHVEFTPRMPYEGTGHIDMFAKFLDNETILISEIQEKTLNTVSSLTNDTSPFGNGQVIRVPVDGYWRSFQAALEIKDFLDQQAEELGNKLFITRDGGTKRYRVLRVPMPVPVIEQTDMPWYPERKVFRSYTNSLTVNQTAIIPQYIAGVDVTYPDEHLAKEYEKEVTEIYQNLGYRPVYIDSDRMIDNGGAVHCVTMQLPRL